MQKYIYLIIIVLLLIAIIITIIFESKKFYVKKFTIENRQIKIGIEKEYSIKIAFFSDLHIGRTLKLKKLKLFLKYLVQLDADIYIFGGDIIGDNIKKYYSYKDVEEVFSLLKDKCCLSVYGNHEFKEENGITVAEKKLYFKAMNFKILNNEEYVFKKGEKQLSIYGLNECIYNEAIFPKKDYDLIISHEGDIIDNIDNQIMLSGHTHGGQIHFYFLPYIYLPKSGKKYISGLYETKKSKIIVSNGIGCNLINVRLFAPRDIILINYIK